MGIVDRHRSLIARGTSLFLINHTQFARELFYQQALRLFAAAVPFELRPPLDVRAAIELALGDGGGGSGGTGTGAADAAVELLRSKNKMLKEYFSIDFFQDPTTPSSPLLLRALPRLVDGHCPRLEYLPDFLVDLRNANWTAEAACFHTVAAALASFYAHPPPLPRRFTRAGAVTTDNTSELEAHRASPESVHALVAHVLLPALKAGLVPPNKLATSSHAVQVASAEKLYTVFERC